MKRKNIPVFLHNFYTITPRNTRTTAVCRQFLHNFYIIWRKYELGVRIVTSFEYHWYQAVVPMVLH